MKIIRQAKTEDIHIIEQIVGQAGLSIDGIVENVDNFLLMEDSQMDQGTAIAVIGLEYQKRLGLLRSLVMNKQTDHFNILELIVAIMEHSKKSGLLKLYLCTSQQASVSLFEQLGFKVESNQSVELQEFDHYQNINIEEPIIMQYTF